MFEADLVNSFEGREERALKAFIGDFEELFGGDFTPLQALAGLSVFNSLSRLLPNPCTIFLDGVPLFEF